MNGKGALFKDLYFPNPSTCELPTQGQGIILPPTFFFMNIKFQLKTLPVPPLITWHKSMRKKKTLTSFLLITLIGRREERKRVPGRPRRAVVSRAVTFHKNKQNKKSNFFCNLFTYCRPFVSEIIVSIVSSGFF